MMALSRRRSHDHAAIPGAQRRVTGAQAALEIMKSEGVDVVFSYRWPSMYDALHGSDLRISCTVTSRRCAGGNGYGHR